MDLQEPLPSWAIGTDTKTPRARMALESPYLFRRSHTTYTLVAEFRKSA